MKKKPADSRGSRVGFPWRALRASQARDAVKNGIAPKIHGLTPYLVPRPRKNV